MKKVLFLFSFLAFSLSLTAQDMQMVKILSGYQGFFAVNIMLVGSYYEPIKQSYETYNYDTHVYETGIIRRHPSGLSLRVGIEW